MKLPTALFCFLALFAMLQQAAPAQTLSYRDVLDNLAKAAPDAPIDLPPAFFQNAESTALGELQRGIVLYAAAGRARECNNPDRVPVLIAAARSCLLYAKDGLAGDQKARCLYYLGLIAEKQEGNQATAASYYEQAGNSNTGAHDALGRIKHANQN